MIAISIAPQYMDMASYFGMGSVTTICLIMFFWVYSNADEI